MYANSLEDAGGPICADRENLAMDTDAIGDPHRDREGWIQGRGTFRGHLLGREAHEDGSAGKDTHPLPLFRPGDSGGGRCGNRSQELSREPMPLAIRAAVVSPRILR